MGRNDRLGNGSGGEAKAREVKTSAEAARDRVGQKDRLGPGCGWEEEARDRSGPE